MSNEPTRKAPRRATPEEKTAAIRRCIDTGASPEAIGRDIGVTGGTIRKWARQAGVDINRRNHAPAKWVGFEDLVAKLHTALNGTQCEVKKDVTLTEPEGATHQIDVVLEPKTPFIGRTLISCKAWNAPVGVSHVREWADIVQQTGAASGVIVAQTGFTADALRCARNSARRVSLWIPRVLQLSDFGPDDESPNGYIAAVNIQGIFYQPEVVEGTFRLDASRADGTQGKQEIPFTFAEAFRNDWYLRDSSDTIVGNLWDQFTARVRTLEASGVVEIVPPTATFLVLAGVRLRLNSFACSVFMHEYPVPIDIDLCRDAIGYENAISKQLLIVPLSPSSLATTLEGV